MKSSRIVKRMLAGYEADPPGVKANLARTLMTGKPAGSGRLMVLAVDGAPSADGFVSNPAAWDPHFAFALAVDGGLSAYAAPLGLIEAGADVFAGQVPTVLMAQVPAAAAGEGGGAPPLAATVEDALRLGCGAMGFVIETGAEEGLDLIEEVAQMREEAAAKGVATLIRCRAPREGGTVEAAVEAVRIAAMLGAHVIEAGPPPGPDRRGAGGSGSDRPASDAFGAARAAEIAEAMARCRRAAFAGRRLMLASVDGALGRDGDVDAAARSLGEGVGAVLGGEALGLPRDAALARIARLAKSMRGRGR